MALVLGLTGKCCVGKDVAAEYFEEHSWKVIHVDQTGHRALQEERAALEAAFGSTIFEPDGRINRKVLGDIVFSDSRKLKSLEAILHPRMREIVENSTRYYRVRGQNVCINAALLFPMDLHRICDYVLVINAPLYLRIKRAIQREGWSYLQILQRFWSQRRLFPKKKTRNVDMYNVWNSESRKVLHQKVEQTVEELLTINKRQG